MAYLLIVAPFNKTFPLDTCPIVMRRWLHYQLCATTATFAIYFILPYSIVYETIFVLLCYLSLNEAHSAHNLVSKYVRPAISVGVAMNKRRRAPCPVQVAKSESVDSDSDSSESNTPAKTPETRSETKKKS